MAPKNSENNYFIRARRNLVITSVVILFYVISKAEANYLTVPGISIAFELKNKAAFDWFLLIFVLYFAWRYYLIRNPIGEGKFFAILKDKTEEQMLNFCKRKALKQHNGTLPKNHSSKSDTNGGFFNICNKMTWKLSYNNSNETYSLNPIENTISLFFGTLKATNDQRTSEYTIPYWLAFISSVLILYKILV